MKTTSLKLLATFSLMAAGLALTTATAQAAGRALSISRSPGSLQRSATWTRPSGQTSNRTFERTLDRDTQSLAQERTLTLANGKTASSELNSVRTDTGRTTTGTVEGINGRSATLNSATEKTDTGFVRSTNVNGADGASKAATVNVSKNDNGGYTRTKSTTTTPANP